MDITILLQGLAAGFVGTIVSAIIYSPAVLGRAWMKASGITEQEFRDRAKGQSTLAMATPMIGATFLTLITATAIAFAADSLGASPGQTFCLALCSVGFAIYALLLLRLFERRPWALVLINSTAHVATFAAIGAIVGLFR